MAGKVVLLNEFIKEYSFKVLSLHSAAGAMTDLIALDMKKKVINGKDW